MQTYAEPRSRPDRLPWLRAKVNGEVIVFKVPPPSAAMAAVKRYGEVMKAARDPATFDMQATENASADVLRLCWDDERLGLESTDAAGLVVELWEHGWNVTVIVSVAAELVKALAAACVFQEDVSNLVDFSLARGKSGPSSSPSGTGISGTRTPSTPSRTPRKRK